MKRNCIIVLAVVATTSWVALTVTAQDGSDAESKSGKSSNVINSSVSPAITLERVDKLIGLDLIDSIGNRSGHVKDLAIDLQNGRVAEVIVATGSRRGFADKVMAIPPAGCSYDASANALRITAEWARVKTAPAFYLKHWEEAISDANVAEVYQHYGMTEPSFSHLVQASKIKGEVVKDDQGKILGHVNNVVVDLPGGQVTKVIVAEGGFLGIDRKLSAVAPQAFRLDPARDSLTLDTTVEALKNAPHFKPDEWWRNSLNDSSTAETVISTPPQNNTSNEKSLTAQDSNVSTQAGDMPTGDAAITIEIQQKILATDGFSFQARHVEVQTKNGRVTLRGKVESESEKDRLGDIAASVVEPRNVDNQIEVITSGP